MAEKTVQTKSKPIEFFGPPRRLVTVGTLPKIDKPFSISGTLKKHLVRNGQALRVKTNDRRAPSFRLRLNPDTPPGTYKGKLSVAKTDYDIIANVKEETNVSILTGELNFTGALGDKASAVLALVNRGNTEITIPRVLPIGLFDDDGLERAFVASYVKPPDGLEQFFETFHGKLRESHSGIIKLAVRKGYGPHSPGSSFLVEFVLNIAKPLKTGHSYHTVVSLGFDDLPLALNVKNGGVS